MSGPLSTTVGSLSVYLIAPEGSCRISRIGRQRCTRGLSVPEVVYAYCEASGFGREPAEAESLVESHRVCVDCVDDKCTCADKFGCGQCPPGCVREEIPAQSTALKPVVNGKAPDENRRNRVGRVAG